MTSLQSNKWFSMQTLIKSPELLPGSWASSHNMLNLTLRYHLCIVSDEIHGTCITERQISFQRVTPLRTPCSADDLSSKRSISRLAQWILVASREQPSFPLLGYRSNSLLTPTGHDLERHTPLCRSSHQPQSYSVRLKYLPAVLRYMMVARHLRTATKKKSATLKIP